MSLVDDTGRKVFRSLEISLVCDACRAAGVSDCPHTAHEVPPWKRDAGRESMVKAIMSADPVLYMRENKGVVSASSNNAFDRDAVDRLCDPANGQVYGPEASTGRVYVCIDPNGGGESPPAPAPKKPTVLSLDPEPQAAA